MSTSMPDGATSTVPAEVAFDHNSIEHARDRAGGYERLRALTESCPMVQSTAYGGFKVVLDWQIARDVLADPAMYSSRDMPGIPPYPVPLGMTQLDPPAITDVRRSLNRVFTPAHAELGRPRARALVAEHIERFVDRGEAELVGELTRRVPATLTMEALGLPLEGLDEYIRVFAGLLSPARGGSDAQTVLDDYMQFLTWIGAIVDTRQEERSNDWISLLLDVEVQGKPLGREAVIENTNVLLAGGVDTTTNVTALSLLHLHHHHDVRDRLASDPTLLGSAFDEYVRIVTPQQAVPRTATTGVNLKGVELCAGEKLLLSLAAANRDPSVFTQPHEVRVDRHPNRHLGFGHGIHHCIGRHIARVWWEEMVTGVLRKIPDYEVLEPEVEYVARGGLNGVLRLPVRFTAR